MLFNTNILETVKRSLKAFKTTNGMHLKYFTLDEFDSPDEADSGKKMCAHFLNRLEKAREMVDGQMVFKINSGYRSKNWNDNVLKAKFNSSHKLGKAADISFNGSRERFLLINSLLSVGFNRLGIGNRFVHVDNDIDKDWNVIWTYNNNN